MSGRGLRETIIPAGEERSLLPAWSKTKSALYETITIYKSRRR